MGLVKRKPRTPPAPLANVSMEQHVIPETLAERWGCGVSTIRRDFTNEPGVLKIGKNMFIPESVAARVHQRKANPEPAV